MKITIQEYNDLIAERVLNSPQKRQDALQGTLTPKRVSKSHPAKKQPNKPLKHK